MNLAIAAFGVGVTAFYLRVLAALMKEFISSSARDRKAFLAKCQPRRKRGELIEMHINPAVRKFRAEAPKRIAQF
jgi:hypothetical protein